ncbi:MAG TPA: glycosyltransferase family 39 protein, partial [Ktedonobacterales bacterium]|nr:glycosyltransferase family 39 protein [Ktedonobacterales bacterium]
MSPAFWRAPLERWLPTLIALVAVALYLPPINQFSSNYDEGVYWQSLRAMQEGHPLYSAVFSSQPPYFLTSIYPFYRLFGQSIAGARVGVAVFAIIGIAALFWLGAELEGLWGGAIAAALLVLDPNYLAQARTLESDGPAVAVSIVAVALAVAAMRRPGVWQRRLAALSGVVIAYGILIKLFDVVALIPI